MRPAAVILTLALIAGNCVRTPSGVESGAYRGASVVLISIDTLRADRLKLYGYAPGSTPVLDRFGRDALVFDEVYSHAPLTLPSHASLFTGMLPHRHGVRDNIGYALDAARPMLAARLKAAGYRTGAAVSSFVLRHQTGIGRGFDFYDDRIRITGPGESLAEAQRDGAETVEALASWIVQQGDAPTFAFLHLYEPHTPYAPPPAYRMADPYDGEVSYADALVGRFLDRLRSAGRLDRAIVSVVSDHGEGLGDHGEAEHGIFLYREALRVPWLLRLPPPSPAGVRVAGTIGLVDVTATLLDLVGADTSGLDGRSVVADLTSGRVADRFVVSETMYPRLHFGWSDLAAVTHGRHRFIRAPRPELFDVAADAAERRNIIAERASTASELRAALDRATAGATLADPTPASADVRRRLEALGYASRSSSPRRGDAALADPKDTIASYEALKRAQGLVAAGHDPDAIRELRALVAAEPGMLDAWESLAKALATTGRTKEAIAAFGRVLAFEPLKPETHLALARIYALDGNRTLAEEHARLAAERDPAAAYEMLAGLAMDAGRLDDAAARARRSVNADPSRYVSHFLLGTVAHRQGRFAQAIAEFRRAVAAKALEPHAVVRNLHAALGDCLARTGQPAEAEREFKTELSLIPSSPEARIGLASLYRSQGRDEEARAALGGLIAATPNPTSDTYATVVRTFTVLGDEAAAREWRAQARRRFPRDARFQ